MTALGSLASGRRLLVFVGPGGVGKTTLAAATAIDAARAGRRVAVITIDPAKRLADALGLDGLDDALRPVPGIVGGTLDAAMLDTRTSYDSLIARVADDPVERQRIFDNRVYQSFSRTLARSHAYVAMERLHDLYQLEAHDLIILDTPPTRSALDILDAPGRLSRFLDERVLAAFVADEGRGAGAWLRAKGTQAALRLFGAMAGDALMGELAGFFEVFFHLRDGFTARAATVQAALRAADTRFVLVSAPASTHLADAAYLRDSLLARHVPVDALVFNRAFHRTPTGAPLDAGEGWDPGGLLAQVWPDAPAEALATLEAARAERARRAEDDRARAAAVRAFAQGVPTARVLRLPRVGRGPDSVDELAALAAASREEGRWT